MKDRAEYADVLLIGDAFHDEAQDEFAVLERRRRAHEVVKVVVVVVLLDLDFFGKMKLLLIVGVLRL